MRSRVMPRVNVVIGFAISTCVLGACGRKPAVNPPTDPAPAIEASDSAAPGIGSGAAGAELMPGTGPISFVGRWSANVEWCAAPSGEGRPIEITATRFEGYGKSCEIAAVDETINGYDATLNCIADGLPGTERVNMAVTGQTLTLTGLDRSGEPVALTKCTTLGDTSTKAPALPMP